MDQRVRSVSVYLLRLIGGLLVIIGVLGIFTALSQGNLIGTGISVAFVAGGVALYRQSVRVGRAGSSASVSRGTR